ncbi:MULTISPECIES: hypothetical protein [Ehrlichia]|uniref:hypothetical protein n=1 Tax=Ehrlichia TaxID=943 RepID=UPI0005F82276|nr:MULTISPECIES: hypothetical protein [Ehrlichia]OUC04464.1 hypothetical protein DB91_02760 [Ehrlichia sp. Wisconsin_h]
MLNVKWTIIGLCSSKRERRVLCRIRSAFEVFKSSMQVIEEENATTNNKCFENVRVKKLSASIRDSV